jgi:8-oxo-dGTP pyrophosphatase MutT (NUDIX family)
MNRRDFVIPEDRLPAGFAESVDRPPDPPAEALPAATTVLIRDGDDGLELLLLRRNRSSGFVPGAYVFAGGRVDPDDQRLSAELMASPPGDPPLGYWVAAARELFEETGVLLALRGDATWREPDESWRVRWRERLMTGETALEPALREAGVRLDLASLVHFAHWITPLPEPRRFDTHFFLAPLPEGWDASPDAREMTDARWLSPAHALRQFQEGELPMVFPTVYSIEELEGFATVESALAAFRGRRIEPIMPRLVRSRAGISIELEQDRTS